MTGPTLSVIGCTVVDVLFTHVPRLPRWPNHSEFTRMNLVLLACPPIVTLGGNGANAAYVAAVHGTRVDLYSSLGRDAFGTMAGEWLRRAGCRVCSPRQVVATACNVTATDRRQRRATYFYPGAGPYFPRIAARKGDAVLVCGWPHPPLTKIAREFKRLRAAGVITILDLGPILGPVWRRSELKHVLENTDVLLGNEHEILTLTQERNLDDAHALLRRGCPGYIVIKRGRNGAAWSSVRSADLTSVPARKVRTMNTVGAGDAFNGALISALLRGEKFAGAVHAATRFASTVVASTEGVLHARPDASAHR